MKISLTMLELLKCFSPNFCLRARAVRFFFPVYNTMCSSKLKLVGSFTGFFTLRIFSRVVNIEVFTYTCSGKQFIVTNSLATVFKCLSQMSLFFPAIFYFDILKTIGIQQCLKVSMQYFNIRKVCSVTIP